MGPVDRDRDGTRQYLLFSHEDGLGQIPYLILPRQRASSLRSSWFPPAAPAVGQTACAATPASSPVLVGRPIHCFRKRIRPLRDSIGGRGPREGTRVRALTRARTAAYLRSVRAASGLASKPHWTIRAALSADAAVGSGGDGADVGSNRARGLADPPTREGVRRETEAPKAPGGCSRRLI